MLTKKAIISVVQNKCQAMKNKIQDRKDRGITELHRYVLDDFSSNIRGLNQDILFNLRFLQPKDNNKKTIQDISNVVQDEITELLSILQSQCRSKSGEARWPKLRKYIINTMEQWQGATQQKIKDGQLKRALMMEEVTKGKTKREEHKATEHDKQNSQPEIHSNSHVACPELSSNSHGASSAFYSPPSYYDICTNNELCQQTPMETQTLSDTQTPSDQLKRINDMLPIDLRKPSTSRQGKTFTSVISHAIDKMQISCLKGDKEEGKLIVDMS